MKQLFWCALVCFAGLHTTDAQIKWVKWMPGDSSQGLFIVADKSGRTYIAGKFYGTVSIDDHTLTSRGDSDVFVLALDQDGDVEFATSFGGPGADSPTAIAVKPDGDLFVAARVDVGFELPDGDVSITTGACVVKFGAGGNVKRSWILEDTGATVTSMKAEHGKQELWMCGFGSDGLFISARNRKGTELFRTSIPLPPEVTVSAMTLDREHNAVVNGSWIGRPKLGELDFPFGPYPVSRSLNFVAKFGKSGSWLWIGNGLLHYGTYFHVDVTPIAMACDANGDVFTTGRVTDETLFVTHHSSTGALVSVTTRGIFRGSYRGLGIALDRSGAAYTVGYGVGSWSNPNRRFAALIIGPNFEYEIRSSTLEDRSYARGICLDDNNRVYVAGDFTGTATFGGALLGDAESSSSHVFVMRIDDAMRRKK